MTKMTGYKLETIFDMYYTIRKKRQFRNLILESGYSLTMRYGYIWFEIRKGPIDITYRAPKTNMDEFQKFLDFMLILDNNFIAQFEMALNLQLINIV